MRWTPSNTAPSASRRSARALVLRVQLDAAAAPRLERMAELEELRLDVRPGAPCGRAEPGPADLDGAVLGSQGQEAGRPGGLRNGRSSRADLRARLGRGEGLVDVLRSTAPGLRLDDAQPAPLHAGPATPPRVLPRARARAARAGRRGLRARGTSTAPPAHRPLRACRSTSTRAWSASRIFDELVRSSEQAVVCPECGAGNVLRQLSTFAVHGAKATAAAPASTRSGGCCGGAPARWPLARSAALAHLAAA